MTGRRWAACLGSGNGTCRLCQVLRDWAQVGAQGSRLPITRANSALEAPNLGSGARLFGGADGEGGWWVGTQLMCVRKLRNKCEIYGLPL